MEIGAWDGKHLSNTWNLIVNKGWSGLLVEADPVRVADMESRYASRPDVQCVCALVGFGGGGFGGSGFGGTVFPPVLDIELCKLAAKFG